MLKKFLTLFFGILLITACANTNANDNDNNDDNNDAPSSSRSNSSNASEGDADSDESDEPLPPITATLKIARTGVQIAGSETVHWSLSGEVEIVILRDQLSFSPSSPHLAKVLLQVEPEEEEEEVPPPTEEEGEEELPDGQETEDAAMLFTASGQGSGTWRFAGSNCTGGGEFGLQYEVSGQYNPETGAIDMQLVENWTGGSSSVICAGIARSGPIPPDAIPLNPIKMGECENGDAQVENKWVQHPEIYGGGISWFDQFTLEALEISGPDGADAASDLSADLSGEGSGDDGETAEIDANATQPFESDPAVADADANVTPESPDDPDTADSNADVTPESPDDPDTADSNADVTPESPDDPDTADSNADVTPESPDDPDTADSDASANPPLTSTCPDG